MLDNLNRLQAQTKGGQVKEIVYDKTDQVQTVTGGAGEAYTYDLNGNRTGGGYTTGAGNRLMSDGTYNYQYDDEGNRTSRTNIVSGAVDEYGWDYRNRLTGIVSKDGAGVVIKTVGYEYDVDDLSAVSGRIGAGVSGGLVSGGALVAGTALAETGLGLGARTAINAGVGFNLGYWGKVAENGFKIINRWQSWKLISNYGQNGNNAWISINKKTRKVIDGGFSIAMNRDIAVGIAKKVCQENNWIFCDQGLSLIDDSPYWSIWAIIKYKPEGCLVIRTDEITITISQKTGEVIRAGNPPR